MPTVTFGEAIRQAYEEEMTRDENVFLMGEDVGRWGSLYRSSTGLLEKFGPDQIKDAPISEAAIAGCGVGAAAMGMRPNTGPQEMGSTHPGGLNVVMADGSVQFIAETIRSLQLRVFFG